MENAKKRQNFICEKCDFICSKQCDWVRHSLTSKHQNRTNRRKIEPKSNQKKTPEKNCQYCNTFYKSKSGLWNHQQKCKMNNEILQSSSHVNNDHVVNIILDNNSLNSENTETTYYNGQDITELKPEEYSCDIILHLIKQNEEFKQIMVEQNKSIIDMMSQNQNVVNNNTINSHNKTTNNQFNLQFFLNETCKDAMNITDFIDCVKLKLDDFEQFGELGYPKALGHIIVRNLNELEIHQRPIHCADLKREVLYIKNDGVWQIDEDREFMKKSIMYVAHKNIKQIPEWLEANPDSKDYQSKTFEKYNKMFRASLGPVDDEEKESFLKKITTMVAKEVVIDKKKTK